MNPFEMFKNLGAVQEQLKQAQEKLSEIRATGSAGGNMVQVTLNGKFEIQEIKLDPICESLSGMSSVHALKIFIENLIYSF